MSIDPCHLSLGADAGETPAAQPPPDPSAAPRPLGARDAAGGFARAAHVRIGRNLRLLYADVLEQPLPERFEALLAELAARDDTGGSS